MMYYHAISRQNFVAVHGSAFAHSTHISHLVNAIASRQQKSISVIVRSPVAIFELSPLLLAIIGVNSRATHILLDRQGEHIRQRRAREATNIIDGIPEALSKIEFYGRHDPKKNNYTLIGRNAIGKLLLVGVKFITHHLTHPKQDEVWINTAYFIREPELRRLLNNGRIRPRHPPSKKSTDNLPANGVA